MMVIRAIAGFIGGVELSPAFLAEHFWLNQSLKTMLQAKVVRTIAA
jgi:hypothetical protein